MKPFSTYPEDRAAMLRLCDEIKRANCCEDIEEAGVALADFVRAILEDEAGVGESFAGCDPDGCKAHIEAFMQRAQSAETRTVVLEKALEPFAAEADRRSHLVLGTDIDHWNIGGNALTFGDLRRARLAVPAPAAPLSPKAAQEDRT